MNTIAQMDFSKPLNALEWLRKLYEDHRRWTDGVFFRDEMGNRAPAKTAAACCLAGGLQLASRDMDCIQECYDALVQSMTTPAALSLFNDNNGYHAVLVLLDKTIAKLKGA